jgi:dienelactone hydrolase
MNTQARWGKPACRAVAEWRRRTGLPISQPARAKRCTGVSVALPIATLAGLICFSLLAFPSAAAEKKPKPKPWPEVVQDIRYPSAADNTDQPALYYDSGSKKKRPLLVALHSWSGNYKQTAGAAYGRWCIEHDWIMIHPNFRGPNWTPQAMGSELVVQDIISAVEYAKANASVDEERIYLVGVSGGGYGSLLMAGRAPEIWAGVSSWVPIADLKAWYHECRAAKRKYADNIVKAAGGVPENGSAAEEECRRRSASSHLPKAKGVPLDINAGIHDGHTGSVPVSHTLNAFNLVAEEEDRLTPEQIDFFTTKRKVPGVLADEKEMDWSYGSRPVLFRRSSGTARVTIFEGGHEIVHEAALKWLAKQRKE